MLPPPLKLSACLPEPTLKQASFLIDAVQASVRELGLSGSLKLQEMLSKPFHQHSRVGHYKKGSGSRDTCSTKGKFASEVFGKLAELAISELHLVIDTTSIVATQLHMNSLTICSSSHK